MFVMKNQENTCANTYGIRLCFVPFRIRHFRSTNGMCGGLAALFGNYIEFWLYINIYSRALPPLIIIYHHQLPPSTIVIHHRTRHISHTIYIIIIIYS